MTETAESRRERLVVLDTLVQARPLWHLAEQRDALPAELDYHGRPVPAEEARLVLWVTRACHAEVSLRRVPGGGHVYRVIEH